jgi:hypothetical protein
VEARRGEADAHHILARGLHREVANGAEVAAVVHRHHPDPAAAGLVHGQAHRPGPHDDAEALARVDHRGGGRLALDPPARARVELAGPVVANVGAQHVGDPVGLHPAQVGHHQHVGGVGRVLRGDAELLEDPGHGLTEGGIGHPDLVLLRHLEALEDHGSCLPRES